MYHSNFSKGGVFDMKNPYEFNVRLPVVFCKKTSKHILLSTLLILMLVLITHINKATCLRSSHPVPYLLT